MAYPEAWLASTLEAAGNCPAYPVMGREGTPPPYIVFARDGTADDITLEQTFGSDGVTTASFAVDIYADSYATAKDIAAAVRAAVRCFSGEVSGLTIHKATAEEDRDGAPVLLDGRDIPTYIIEQTYSVSWSES